MALQDVLNSFTTILNRNDCTQPQAVQFITEGMQRITRELRIPSMERLIVGTSTGAVTAMDIPPDFIEPIDLYIMSADPGCWTNPLLNGVAVPNFTFIPLRHLTYRQLLRVSVQDNPTAYARFQGQFQIRGAVPPGVEYQLSYYGEFTPITSLTSDNEITASSPDLLTYAALSYAADYFQHPNLQTWEARYQSLLTAVSGVASGIEFNGGSIAVQSAYANWEY